MHRAPYQTHCMAANFCVGSRPRLGELVEPVTTAGGDDDDDDDDDDDGDLTCKPRPEPKLLGT
jgi:hypothetical protein